MGKPLTHCGYDWRVCKAKHEKEEVARHKDHQIIQTRLDAMDDALILRTGELERNGNWDKNKN
jgi:hypothetical protein